MEEAQLDSLAVRERPRKVRCVDCPLWVPAVTWSGLPSGRGGCPYTYHNLRGDRPRVCRLRRWDQDHGQVRLLPKL